MAMGAKTTVLASPVLALRPWACHLGYVVSILAVSGSVSFVVVVECCGSTDGYDCVTMVGRMSFLGELVAAVVDVGILVVVFVLPPPFVWSNGALVDGILCRSGQTMKPSQKSQTKATSCSPNLSNLPTALQHGTRSSRLNLLPLLNAGRNPSSVGPFPCCCCCCCWNSCRCHGGILSSSLSLCCCLTTGPSLVSFSRFSSSLCFRTRSASSFLRCWRYTW